MRSLRAAGLGACANVSACKTRLRRAIRPAFFIETSPLGVFITVSREYPFDQAQCTKTVLLPPARSFPDPVAKRVFRVQDQVPFGVHECRPGDAGDHESVLHLDASFKDASRDALLPPDLIRLQFAVGIEASQLRARAR